MRSTFEISIKILRIFSSCAIKICRFESIYLYVAERKQSGNESTLNFKFHMERCSLHIDSTSEDLGCVTKRISKHSRSDRHALTKTIENCEMPRLNSHSTMFAIAIIRPLMTHEQCQKRLMRLTISNRSQFIYSLKVVLNKIVVFTCKLQGIVFDRRRAWKLIRHCVRASDLVQFCECEYSFKFPLYLLHLVDFLETANHMRQFRFQRHKVCHYNVKRLRRRHLALRLQV